MKRNLSVLFCICFLLAAGVRAQNFGMRMHVINIGQGDAILLEFQHHAVLVDTGAEDTTDAGRYEGYLTKYLDDFFARRTDLNKTLYGVVLSHPHPDHAKYLLTVMNRYNVETFIEGGGTTSHVKSILTNARKKIRDDNKVRLVIRNNTINSAAVKAWIDGIETGSNAKVTILSGRRYCSNENNDSVVMRVEFGQKSFLLTGDSENLDEAPNNCGGLIGYLLHRPNLKPLLDADVYKVGHHGSYNGTHKDFLDAITPQYSVISAGKYADKKPGGFHAFQFGHPRGNKTVASGDSFLKIVSATTGTRPTVEVYYLDRANDTRKNKFTLDKGVYCTCWDDNIIFEVNSAGDDISVGTKASP